MSRRRAATLAVASSVWNAALLIAATPVYLSILGIEAYGLIGFYITLQAVLQILDLGFAPAINREVARTTAVDNVDAARVLLRTLACLYWVSAPVLAAGFYLSAPAIAGGWLKTEALTTSMVSDTLIVMGLLVAARWPIVIYQNALIGAQRLGLASVVGAVMNALSVGAAIAAISLISPQPQMLFAAQAVVSLLHALVLGALAWRALDGRRGARASLSSLRSVWRFSAGMGGVTLTSIALTQLDKALLSRILSLPQFGEYMLAVTVVGGLSVLFGPLFNTVFPDYSARVARGEATMLAARYQSGTRLFAVLYLPIVVALGMYAHDLIWVWTGDRSTADAVAPLIILLCIGTGINGLMHFPYAMQLAHGFTSIPLLINVTLLAVSAPAIVLLAARFGGLGGAMAWAGLQLAYLFVGTYMTHRRMPLGSGAGWLLGSVLLPAALAGVTALALQPVVLGSEPGSMQRLGAISVSVLLSALLCALCLPDTRKRLAIELRNFVRAGLH